MRIHQKPIYYLKEAAIKSAIAGFFVVSPLISVTVLPIIASRAAVHGVAMLYFKNKTRDAEGPFIGQLDVEHKFQVEDLPKIEYEIKRLMQEKQLVHQLRNIRAWTKCLIPIIGALWALHSEAPDPGVWKDNKSVISRLKFFRSLRAELKLLQQGQTAFSGDFD
ncbi:MAG: hypothetical protein ACSNEK_03920 [Parachlamydiaceae bacterium]